MAIAIDSVVMLSVSDFRHSPLCAGLARSFLALSLALHPVAEAFVVSVDRTQNLRQVTGRGSRAGEPRVIGQLQPGQKVEIPDQILPASLRSEYYRGDEKARETAILFWLKSASQQTTQAPDYRYTYRTRNGRGVQDYFVPVVVLDEQGRRTKQQGVMSLSYLMSQKQQLIVETAAPLYAKNAARAAEPTRQVPDKAQSRGQGDSSRARAEAEKATATEAGVPDQCTSDCGRLSQLNSIAALRDHFLDPNGSIQRSVREVERTAKTMQNAAGYPSQVKQNFERTCPGSWAAFKSAVEREAAKHGIPVDVLWSLMHKESSGKCHAFNPKDSKSGSVGLFQINGGKSYDPITNLKDAVSILVDKYNKVNKGATRRSVAWTNLTAKERDLWRKAMAAYNGGEKYLLESAKAMAEYNRKFLSTSTRKLDPNSWEDQRLFMLRFYLARRDQDFIFGSALGSERTKMSIKNIANVEAILGREEDGHNSAIIERWIGYGLEIS